MKHVERLKVMCCCKHVGTLAIAEKLKIIFEYSPQWLLTGFDLAPRSLAFNAQPQIAKDSLFEGLHGVFNDSLPDGWGLLLMDRALNDSYGWNRGEINPLDRLAYIGARAMGALEYEPEYEKDAIEDEINISEIAVSVGQVLSGDKAEILPQLRIQGGSPGGARPKVTVALSDRSSDCLSGFNKIPTGYQHWLVKFRSKEDSDDMGCAEKAYSEMALLAGIKMPKTALVNVVVDQSNEQFFAVRRFDRKDNEKIHVITMAGLYYANFRLPCIDYKDVLAATASLTNDMQQVERAFRLMAFNVLAHNKDDHAKNFSFIRLDGRWEISPAYDLTFSHGMGGEHTTSIAGSGNPNADKLLGIASGFHIDNGAKIIGEVRYAVSQWPSIAKRNNVSMETTNEITIDLKKIDARFNEITMTPFGDKRLTGAITSKGKFNGEVVGRC